MLINELKPKHKTKGRKRIGRGGKKGTYSGKGLKGQSSRAGRKKVPFIRELIKRYPKLRGYKFNPKTRTQGLDVKVVNLDVLDKKFNDGDMVNPQILLEKGLIKSPTLKNFTVKILGKGKIGKKLVIENCQMSQTAKEAIVKSGGSVK